MIYRRENGPSLLGIGIMRWPDRPIYKKIHQFVETAFANGVNYFESCMFYNGGNCEKILSGLLKEYPREDYFLCGKLPSRGAVSSTADVKRIFEGQLKEFGTNYFDYYLLQCVDRDSLKSVQDFQMIEFLLREKKKGRIKNIGFSFHDNVEWLETFLSLCDWDCVQIQLNYVDWYRNNHNALYDLLVSRNIPIIVMGALKGGQLTYGLPKTAIRLLNEADPESSIGSWGMRFVAQLPGVQTILTGATELDELEDNISAISKVSHPLDQELLKRVAEIYAESFVVPCTGCKYCERHCPKKRPIARTFQLFNRMITNYSEKDKEAYLQIQKHPEHGMDSCTGCQQCSKNCPQKIDIPRRLMGVNMNYR